MREFDAARAGSGADGEAITRARVGLSAVLAVLLALLGSAVFAVTSARPVAADPVCGSTAATGLAWSFGADLQAQKATPTNGGCAANSGSSSGTGTVPEECDVTLTMCGRGQFGGAEGHSKVLLNNGDEPNTNVHFACGNGQTAGDGGAPASRTASTTSAGAPPALILAPGNFAGGERDATSYGVNSIANPSYPTNPYLLTGDTQCYNPYAVGTQGDSAAAGALATQRGQVSKVATIPQNGTQVTNGSVTNPAQPVPVVGGANASFYVPQGTATTACAGHVVAAGGLIPPASPGTAIADSRAVAYYDPRWTTTGGPMNPTFNTWTTTALTLSDARDSIPQVKLNDGRILLAGGETLPAGVDSFAPDDPWDLFDPASCSFTASGQMPHQHYDGDFAVFPASSPAAGKALWCGGQSNNGGDKTCDLFDPATATWTSTGTATLSKSRPGGELESSLPDGNILVAGGDNFGPGGAVATSEECRASTATTVVCGEASTGGDTNNYNEPNNPFAFDASHLRIGSVTNSSATAATGKDLVLGCGGFGGSSFKTPAGCQFYVAAGVTTPSIPNIDCSPQSANPGSTNGQLGKGPAWCVTKSGATFTSDMNRERASFLLAEVPPMTCPSGCASGDAATGDELLAMGGFYGTGDASGNDYLTRKNVEVRPLPVVDTGGGGGTTGPTYVGLGDSYSSGEGLASGSSSTDQPYDLGTDVATVNECHRHVYAYPRQLSLRDAGIGPVAHYACSGATTVNIWGQGQWNENRQIQHAELNSNTRLVTLTIGGNDANFSKWLTQCNKLAFGGNCDHAAISSDVSNVAAGLDTALYQIRASTSPNTVIVLMGYPHVFPSTLAEQTCMKLANSYTLDNMNFLNSETDHLRNVEAQVAANRGIYFDDVITRFAHHEICGNAGDWINWITADPSIPGKGSFHPMQSGHLHGYEEELQSFLVGKI